MDLTGLIEGGNVHPALLIAVAMVLGALHGLEPGHAKTMIAAYIIAVRGTAAQALLLGLSAAASHSVIVWAVAAAALSTGSDLLAERAEPYFLVASGGLVLAMAGWIGGRLQGERRLGRSSPAGPVVSPQTHVQGPGGGSGARSRRKGAEIHGEEIHGDDTHARAHAADLRQRLHGRPIGTAQTILFGLTGGLVPCAAAITVLLVCLHLDNVLLGIGLVAGCSIGLGVTLFVAGLVAVWGTKVMARPSGPLDRWLGRLPYLSSVLIGIVGAAMMAGGLTDLASA